MPDALSPTLRHATVNDAATLALLGSATFLDAYAAHLPGEAILAHCARYHTEPAWHALLADPSNICFLAHAPLGAPTGYALLTPPDIPGQQPNDAELRRIYLLTTFQGTGLAATLLHAVRTHARTHGATRLILGVHANNPRARAFYAREGFTEVSTRQFMVGNFACNDLVLAASL